MPKLPQMPRDKAPVTLKVYMDKFTDLNMDKSTARWSAQTTYQAPHKPLLLLSVCDLFAEGSITQNLIEPSLELAELFTLYWSRVMPPDRHGNMALPFFHLKSEKFWHLLPLPGKEAYVDAAKQIRSLNELRETVIGAKLDEDLYALLRLQPSRDELCRVLAEKYFTPEAQAALLNQGVVNQEAYQYSNTLLKQAKDKLFREGNFQDYQRASRDQGFRRAIVSAYDHQCAFCGLKVLTPDGHTAADAAHIIPWSKTHNDAIDNGMALCKLCHWGFDEGLLTASEQYAVIVSGLVRADYNVPAHLPGLAGRTLALPREEAYWPSHEALKWHKQEVYRGR